MKVFLIGAGMGNPDTLTGAARHAVEDCEVLVGAERLIALRLLLQNIIKKLSQ